MPRDARGISRVGMFDKIADPLTGITYEPVSGVNGKVTYQASDGSTLTTSTHRRTGEDLTSVARMQREYPDWPR